MAKVLKITDGTITVDFTTGTMYLLAGGWETESSDEVVWETFKIGSRDTDANIRSAQDDLDELFEKAIDYANDPLEKTPVWIYFQSDGESAKRAVVLSGKTRYNAVENILPWLGGKGASLTVAVERVPGYENESGTTLTGSAISLNGGMWVPGGVAGRLPQRIQRFTLDDGTALDPVTKVWAGIRRTRYGTAHFIAKWECELGTMHSADTTVISDGTVSGTQYVRCTFATTAALAKRFTLAWQDVGGANADDDIIGEYLVLGRIKLGASTEVRVQLRNGWQGLGYTDEIAGDNYFSSIQDSNLANWNLVELGRVKIPSTGNRDGIGDAASDIEHFAIQLYAERLTGSGNFQIDNYVLIPCLHMIKIERTYLWAAGGPTNVYTSPLGEQTVLSRTDDTGALINSYAGFTDWYYPQDGGVLVVAGQEATQHTITYNVTPSMVVYPRWKLFRV